MQNYDVFSPELRQEVFNHFQAENVCIAREYLGRKDGQLFYEPLPDLNESWEPYPEPSAEQIAALAIKIWQAKESEIQQLKEKINILSSNKNELIDSNSEKYNENKNIYHLQKLRRLQKLRQFDSKEYTLKLFDKHKCIFVHIPKTAGVSTAKSLFGNLGGAHTKIREYQQLYTETEFKDYFKFTFVRNPWDRLVSAYHFLITGGMNEQDKNWADSNIRQYPDFNSFVKGWLNRENIYTWKHFIPQFEFVCIEGLEPAVDFIGYFENLEEDFEYVANKLGIQTTLQHLNKTERKTKYYGDETVEIFVDEKKDYTEYYTDETVKIVADVYREDIEIFGYDFG
ncbi:sulfotransferase family protein [Candidatus Woesearchaeota archaeon]|nr:sulfotransferase family protein [Candidatus Woesearchaeota archaeon]